jgi:hypothetical protein
LTVPTSLQPIGSFGFTWASGLLPTLGGALWANAVSENPIAARTSKTLMVISTSPSAPALLADRSLVAPGAFLKGNSRSDGSDGAFQARRNSLRLIVNDVFVLQSFNNNRNSGGAFYSFGLSVLNAFKSPIHVTARFWNDPFHKNTDEGFALCIALSDSVHDNRLKGIGRYRLSFHCHRAVAELGKLEIAIVPAVLPLLACASFLWLTRFKDEKAGARKANPGSA